jgi:hypothetical protein
MMRGLIAIFIATAACLFAEYVTWRFDQQVFRCGSVPRRLSATALIAVSIWLLVLIFAAVLLRVPGAAGPVQFWGGNTSFFDVRAFASFTLLGGLGLCALTILSAVISLFQRSATQRSLRCVCPAIALGAFALAYVVFMSVGFYPSA